MARILIASADTQLRSGLLHRVKQHTGLQVAGFIRSEEEVVPRIVVSTPEILLLDARLAGSSNSEMLAQLSTRFPELQVILYGIDQLEAMGMRKLLADPVKGFRKAPILVNTSRANDLSEVETALKSMFAPPPVAKPEPTAHVSATAASKATTPRKTPMALVIASSTGGPVALMTLVKMLPKDFPLPIAIVQHMPANFTAMLAERLDSSCPLEVVEGAPGMDFIPGRIIIGPGDFHLKLRGTRELCNVMLDQGEREHSCRPAANVLFRSAAEVFGGNVLTLVLTGMGRDGFEGARHLRELGSRVIVQDAATSTVWGMPGAIAQAGFADAILPLTEIANELVRSL